MWEGMAQPGQQIGPRGRSTGPWFYAKRVGEEGFEGVGERGRKHRSVQDESEGSNHYRAVRRSLPQSPSPALALNL